MRSLWVAVVGGLAAVLVVPAPPAVAQTPAPAFTTYALPNAGTSCGGLSGGLAAGADGNVWATGLCGLYRVSPLGIITYFDLGRSTSDIVSGPDGALWFAAGGQVGRMTTTGSAQFWKLPSGGPPQNFGSGPGPYIWVFDYNFMWRVAMDGSMLKVDTPISGAAFPVNGTDGALWLEAGNTFARIDSAGNANTHELHVGHHWVDAVGGRLARASDGTMWLTDRNVGGYAQIHLDGSITSHPVPTSSTNPVQPLVDGPGIGGRPWVTVNQSVGRIETDGSTSLWNAPDLPLRTIAGPDGNEWVAFYHGTIGKLNRPTVPDATLLAGQPSTYVTPSANYTPATLYSAQISSGALPHTNDDGLPCCGPTSPGAHLYLRSTPSPGAPTQTFKTGVWPWRYVAGDWDLDHRQTIGFFHDGWWWLMNPTNPLAPEHGPYFGDPSALPVIGDWNGDGYQTIGIWEPSNATFYLRDSNTSGAPDEVIHYGDPSCTPVTGDWNGDGTDTIGVYCNGWWYLRNSNTPGPPDITVHYGTARYTPVTGRWSGGARDSIGVYDQGTWYLRNTATAGSPDLAVSYGTAGYVPLSGRWTTAPTTGIGVVTDQ